MKIILMGEKVILPTIKEHWTNKFEKAIPILIQSGYTPQQLIDKIIAIANAHEKN